MKIKPRWRKVFIDLWNNKTRTLLVVLSMSVGVFAVGMVTNAYTLLFQGTDKYYTLTNPSSAYIFTTMPFDDDLVDIVRKMPEIREAEGRCSRRMRINLNDQWFTLDLSGINYDKMHVNVIESTRGSFPPGDRQLLISQTAFALTDVDVGDIAIVETPSGDRFEMPVVGLVRDMNSNPSINSNAINAYTTQDTFEWLGLSKDYTRMLVIAAENQKDKTHVQKVASLVKDKVEKAGWSVSLTMIMPEPGVSPVNFIFQTIRVVLGTLAVVSLCLSAFLVYNTISALIISQVNQIGIMKSLGAGRKDLIIMYIGMVACFGILTFFIASPPAACAAYIFAHYIASPALIDLKLPDFFIPAHVIGLEILMALLIPLAAALPPVLWGTRVTVTEAVTSQGLNKETFGKSFIDRQIKRIRFLRGPWLLSVANMLRQKQRVILTMVTLIIGGAFFIGVISVRDSGTTTVAKMGNAYQFDVEVSFEHPYRLGKVSQIALQVPGVIGAEGWGSASSTIVREDGSEGNSMLIMAPPEGSRMTHPMIVQGRWLLPGDENGIVIGTDLQRENSDLKIGDILTLKIKGREYEWYIVGVYQKMGINLRYESYANYPYVASLADEIGLIYRIQLVTEKHDAQSQHEITVLVDKRLRQQGIRVSTLETSTSLRGVYTKQFDIVVKVLLVMAFLIVLVGGLGLAGTMSMNVMERTREIGVMRAIGASDIAVLRVVMIEGVMITLVSWFISVFLAIPVGVILSRRVGADFLNGPLIYQYSILGALIWLALVIILGAVASFSPAHHASKLTVRDVLAYE